jgi:hypothetical protein
MPVVRRRTNIVEQLDAIEAEFPTPTSQECSVCYGTNPNYHQTTNCGHGLCRLCYKRLYEKLCPICRTELNQELYIYKPPFHTPTSRFDKIKIKLELFITRRNLLQSCRGKQYLKYINAMVKYANLYYYKGQYYPVHNVCPYWEMYYIYSIQDVIELYTHALLDPKVPLVLRRILASNVKEAIQFY